MNILVVNCGSSSLKFQLINSETEQVKASGNCERIGLDGNIIYKTGDKKTSLDVELKNHGVAIKKVLDMLASPEDGVISSLDEIHAVEIGRAHV